MKPVTLLWISAALVVAALAIFFVVIPGAGSDLTRRGIRTLGTVEMTDSRPGSDGNLLHTVVFVFADEQGRNHRVERAMADVGRWESFKAGKDVPVWYLPGDPEGASPQGAVGMVTRGSSALRFVAWSLLIAAAVLGVIGFLGMEQSSGSASPSGQAGPRR